MMGDLLPLLPNAEDIICADVRPVLREVFREVEYLPQLVTCLSDENDPELRQDEWIDKFSSECKELYEKEKNLKFKYAKRLAREPLPNIYKMHSEIGSGDQESWTIIRKDLKPTIEQDAGCSTRLWIKNILNKSSGDLTYKPYEPQIQSETALLPVDETTLQSYSIGESISPPPPPPPKLILQPPLPEYMICLPPRIEFINFTIGNVHTESLRLINISKFELRVSVSPPKRRELDVELCSRLVVTSGSAAEFRIHYRPVDVLPITDELLVRVSAGKSLKIPIACYMQPPILEILVPNLTSVRLESMKTAEISRDLLDLGSKLLGDVHRASLLFYCAEKHASFFLLPEDAWLSFCVDVAATSGKGRSKGGAASDNFWLSPVRWSGGGSTRAMAVCYATEPGLHTTALRILCSTAIVRPLNIVADALWFRTNHITLEAHDKDYDICSEDDEACEYFVRLGTALPSRSLSATVEVMNHSPITYPYYWSVRSWGVCSCWTKSQTSLFDDDLCDEAKMNKTEMKTCGVASEDAKAVRVESAQNRLFPRAVTQLTVRVPDVGQVLGIHRAVLMLILKEIPRESFPVNSDPMIVKTGVIEEEGIPGVCSSWSREVCDVVCCQLEVWWEVVPVRFVLDPPVLRLRHSRRIKSTDICLTATQLYGVNGVKANWNVNGAKTINLLPGESIATNFNLQMHPLPNHFPVTDVIQLNAESNEWKSSAFIQRNYDTRHPSLRPAIKWLGLVPPGAKVHTELVVHNDTHQHICWWATCVRWWGERRVANVCAGREPCPQCYQRSCSCALLSPTRGALAHDQSAVLKYSVVAPDTDGVVATLVQVHRTLGDVCMVHTAAGAEARATLLAYRVLAPFVVIRVMPCLGDKHERCKVCSLDTDGRKDCAVLRPSSTLTVGFRSCYRIKCSNLTPLPTTVKWQKPIDGEDDLKVIFIPNDFDLQPHTSINIQVVLDPRRVSPRRIYRVHADVCHAYKPIHLLIDTAISGLEVVIHIPLGGAEKTDTFVSMKIMENVLSRDMKNLTAKEIFEEEDVKRAVRNENICKCRFQMVYIPQVKQPQPHHIDEEYNCVDIITEPPAFTRVCPCANKTKPILPEPTEPYCLQFRSIPLKTVRSRTITIRNVSSKSARITTAIRKWSRVRKRTLSTDKWAGDVQDPGIVIECEMSQRILSPCGSVDVTISVYADCWGLYYDQVLVQIDHLDPLVLDVWIEAVGTPLHFALQGLRQEDNTPTLWMSPSDPQRALHVSNPSRSRLNIHTYIISENEYPQDELPFRLYIRFYDVLPRTCSCATANDSESYIDSEKECSSLYIEMDTEIELFLSRDYGPQDNSYYQIEPNEFTLDRNSSTTPLVTLSIDPAPTPSSVILMRILPIDKQGPGWYRPEPPPLIVRLLAVSRPPRLLVLPTNLNIKICALDLPANELLRIRKYVRISNIGSVRVQTYAVTEKPWVLKLPQEQCFAKCMGSGPGSHSLDLDLLPGSSSEMVVEVAIVTKEMWPKPGEEYDSFERKSSELRFFDEQNIILTSIPLHLDVEFPKLQVEPNKIDFGYVMDGDYRKTYFTVLQTSSTITMEVVIECCGDNDYRIWPPRLTLAPRTRERVYVQFISRWQLWPAECSVRIRAVGAAGVWCMTVVILHAQSTLDRATHLPPHDFTDDSRLSTH